MGEEVAKSRADTWHAAGRTGAGVSVGIVDYFDGALWDKAVGAGELPIPKGGFCRWNGTSCDIWSVASGLGYGDHGEAVAEIVHEMAPGADLYLASVSTTADLQAAVNYFAAVGVSVVSRSLGGQSDG